MKYFLIITFFFAHAASFASEVIGSSDLNVFVGKFNEALEMKEKATPTERAQFYYETTLNEERACTHCPEYLKLIGEVNKIVGKLATSQDVTNSNNQLIQLDRLKFMYLETVAASVNGTETCSIFNNMDPTMNGIDREKLTVVAEELISLPNITSIQYYPNPPEKEVRYLYRGEGLQSHILIEVIVKADKTAVIRYHHYDPYNLPDIGGKVVEKPRKLNEFQSSSSLNDHLAVDTKTVVHLSNQSTQATLRSNNSDWVKIEAHHKNNSEASIKAILPVEVSLPSQSGLKITGAYAHEQKEHRALDEHSRVDKAHVNFGSDKNNKLLKAEIEIGENQKTMVVGSHFETNMTDTIKVRAEIEQKDIESKMETNRDQKMGLSISNEKGTHEYVSAVVDKNQDREIIHLSTKHQWAIGDEKRDLRVKGEASQKTTESHFEEGKTQGQEMLLSLTDRNHEYVTARVVQGDDLDRLISLSSRYSVGDLGSVNASVNRYDSGKENISLGHQMRSGKNSFQTNLGHDSESGQFINFKAERKISSTASMILTVQTDTNNEASFMYQYENKF